MRVCSRDWGSISRVWRLEMKTRPAKARQAQKGESFGFSVFLSGFASLRHFIEHLSDENRVD